MLAHFVRLGHLTSSELAGKEWPLVLPLALICGQAALPHLPRAVLRLHSARELGAFSPVALLYWLLSLLRT